MHGILFLVLLLVAMGSFAQGVQNAQPDRSNAAMRVSSAPPALLEQPPLMLPAVRIGEGMSRESFDAIISSQRPLSPEKIRQITELEDKLDRA